MNPTITTSAYWDYDPKKCADAWAAIGHNVDLDKVKRDVERLREYYVREGEKKPPK